MKIAFAALALTAATVGLSATPAHAESSYWEQRWRSRDATPEYGQFDDRRPVAKKRRYPRGQDRRASYRRFVEEYESYGDSVPRPFRIERNDGRAHPTMNNDYWLQSSIYDFQDGRPADLKKYRY